MQFNNRALVSPDLEEAVDRQPLIISPETTLEEAIELMSQVKGSCCNLVENAPRYLKKKASSCVLVMERQQIEGIVTERDIVKLTASEIDIKKIRVREVMTKEIVTLKEENFKDVFAALFLFRRYKIRHLPLVDSRDRLIGMISSESIREAIRPANLLKLRRVADVMSKSIITADVSNSIVELARLMAENRVSCVIITQEDTEENIITPVGIVTERDIVKYQYLNLNFTETIAGEVMSSPLLLLSPDDSLLFAHQKMIEKKVRRLVVSWNWGQGLGIITQTSLLKIFDPMEMYSVIESLEKTVQQLEAENKKLLDRIKQNV